MSLSSIKTFSTVTHLSRNDKFFNDVSEIGPLCCNCGRVCKTPCQMPKPNETAESRVISQALKLRARVVVRTSTGTWYIQGHGSRKTYEETEEILTTNLQAGKRPKSKTYLFKYDNE